MGRPKRAGEEVMRGSGAENPPPEGRQRIVDSTAEPIRSYLEGLPGEIWGELEEIRIRKEKPLLLSTGPSELFIDEQGRASPDLERALITPARAVDRTLQLMARGSLYSLEEELRRGYLTLEGGHRVGMTGRAVLSGGRMEGMREISALNIRFCRELIGAGRPVIGHLLSPGGNRIPNTLVVSPPGCGKTTLLRDLARMISSGLPELGFEGSTVSIVDERSEIGGSYRGIPQNELGPRCDLLDGCPKAEGIMLLIRSMSPEVVVTDEIGREEDIRAISEALNAGVSVLASLHARDLREAGRRPSVSTMMNSGFFERFVVLSRRLGPGTVEEVRDSRERVLNKKPLPPAGRE